MTEHLVFRGASSRFFTSRYYHYSITLRQVPRLDGILVERHLDAGGDVAGHLIHQGLRLGGQQDEAGSVLLGDEDDLGQVVDGEECPADGHFPDDDGACLQRDAGELRQHRDEEAKPGLGPLVRLHQVDDLHVNVEVLHVVLLDGWLDPPQVGAHVVLDRLQRLLDRDAGQPGGGPRATAFPQPDLDAI